MSFDPSHPEYNAMWVPKGQAQQKKQIPNAERVVQILESIAFSLQSISDTLAAMRPEVTVNTPPPEVVVNNVETSKVSRIIRDEKNPAKIVSVITETKRD